MIYLGRNDKLTNQDQNTAQRIISKIQYTTTDRLLTTCMRYDVVYSVAIFKNKRCNP